MSTTSISPQCEPLITIRSAPPVSKSMMNHAEPFRRTRLLQWRWWAQPIINGAHAVLRVTTLVTRATSPQQNRVS